MRYIAAYLLLVQGGNAKPTADDVKSFLTGLEVDVDEKALGLFFEKLGDDVNVEDLLKAGSKKLCSGGGAGGGSGAAGGAAGGDAAAAEEEKEEEEEEEEEEVALGGLVGGGDDDGW
eukprot:g2689.t1